jgi:methionyl-tRNA formyltransferase
MNLLTASDIWLVGDEVACRTVQEWARESSSSAIKIVAASDLAHRIADTIAGPRGPEPWLISMNSTVIIGRTILERFDGRAVNIHPGRLPDFAGLYAVQWAIRLGESVTAATAHFMTETLDAGDIIYAASVPISPHDTGLTTWLRCLRTQAKVLKWLLTEITAGRELPRISQDLSLRRCFKAADALGDELPSHLHATEAERWVRAGNYQPLSSPTYRPKLVIPNPRLALWLDQVAVADCGVPMDLAPGEARVLDGKLIVGCAAGSALVLNRARVIASARLPSQWSRAIDNITLIVQLPEVRLLIVRQHVQHPARRVLLSPGPVRGTAERVSPPASRNQATNSPNLPRGCPPRPGGRRRIRLRDRYELSGGRADKPPGQQ